jgi:hypothetical protein
MSSAGEAPMQIQQCFNEPYADQTTTTQQRSTCYWVVSSNTISKEAIEAIKGVSVIAYVGVSVLFVKCNTLTKRRWAAKL